MPEAPPTRRVYRNGVLVEVPGIGTSPTQITSSLFEKLGLNTPQPPRISEARRHAGYSRSQVGMLLLAGFGAAALGALVTGLVLTHQQQAPVVDGNGK